jgi:hypothetical protein
VKVSSFVFGALLVAAGVLLAGGWMPGADSMATGPRIGFAVASFMFAALVMGVPLAGWYVRKFTRPEDYEGGCPVGSVCTQCETFNFNPRKKCKECGTVLEFHPVSS